MPESNACSGSSPGCNMEDRFWKVKTVPREGGVETVAGAQGENDTSLASGDSNGDGEGSTDGGVQVKVSRTEQYRI